MREQVRFGKSDLGTLSGQLALGKANIRSAAQQLRWYADGHLRWNLGYKTGTAQHGIGFPGQFAQQNGQGILGLSNIGFETGDRCLGTSHKRAGLSDIQFGNRAGFKPDFGDFQ